jgi:hypothetical protein
MASTIITMGPLGAPTTSLATLQILYRINTIKLRDHKLGIKVNDNLICVKGDDLNQNSNNGVIFCNIIGCRFKTSPS